MKIKSSVKTYSSIRYSVRYYFRAVLFIGLFAYAYLYCLSPIASTNPKSSVQRKLLQNSQSSVLRIPNTTEICIDPLKAHLASSGNLPPDVFTYDQLKEGFYWLHFVGMVYLFLAISLVCDECFSPALDAAIDATGVSPDVAGAIFMAAGGSAPELATSFIGTAFRSDVGFGTIVGSAVFNILFVIGCCVLASKEILSLTWWPLFRDCMVYCVGLIVLALFFSVVTPNRIDWWEAMILLLMYGGYCFIMTKNKQLENWVTSCVGKKKSEGAEMQGSDAELGELKQEEADLEDIPIEERERAFKHRNTVLAIAKGAQFVKSAEDQVIRRIRGSMDECFNNIDADGDGFIDHDEFTAMVKGQSLNATDEEISALIQKLDINSDGKITRDEFQTWYFESTKRVYKDAADAFDKYSKDRGDGVQKVNMDKIKKVLSAIDKSSYKDSDSIVKQAHDEIQSADKKYITKQEFDSWYQNSDLVEKTMDAVKNAAEAEVECEGLNLNWPDTLRSQISFILTLPLVMPMYLTIPNVQTDKWRNWWAFSFFMSIVWIAIWSFLMVAWATIWGLTIGIPTKIMGLIFLAMGTSIPDLITSIAVAVQGRGDMAISSSIGSNIFDILVGMPLPWFIISLGRSEPIEVGSPKDNVVQSVLILLGVVVIVITTIACVGWKMDKKLAFVFFLFYFIFLAQELVGYYGNGGPDC